MWKKKICVIITIIILAILVFGGFFLWQSQFSLSIGESKIDKEEFLYNTELLLYP